MENYNKVYEFCKDHTIELLTTFEEFEDKRKTTLKEYYQFVRIDFIGICGHPSSAVVTNFMTRKTGVTCKYCIKQNTKKVLNTKSHLCTTTECDGISLLEKYLSETYEIIRTKEGCLADLAIRKKEINQDLYIPIQIKVTNTISHKMYSFRGLKSSYKDMLLVLICIKENKLWVIPYNNLNIKSTLNISEKSKYNKYLVIDNTLLSQSIEKYIDQLKLSTLKELMTPLSIYQKREQDYIQKREKYINFLNYTYLSIQNTPTDFLINNKKIQEKVCGYLPDKNALLVHLASNNGKKENGIRKFRTYRLGENDYYWFHSSIDTKFWIVPEEVLYEKSYISDTDETVNKKCLYICLNNYNSSWIKEYEFDYDNIDKEQLYSIFYD